MYVPNAVSGNKVGERGADDGLCDFQIQFQIQIQIQKYFIASHFTRQFLVYIHKV